MSVVVLVSGKRFCGKDTFADFLEQRFIKLGKRCVRLAVAEDCKRLFAEEKKLSFEMLNTNRDYKELHRSAMTQFFWEKGICFFEDATCARIVNDAEKSVEKTCYIVSDFRFESLFRKLNGKIRVKTVRITCDDKQRSKRGFVFDAEKENSATETALDTFDFETVLENNGTLVEFQHVVDKYCESIVY